MQLFLTHTPESLANYYGEGAVAALEQVARVKRNPTALPLDAEGLLRHAAGCEVILSDRQTPGTAELFANAQHLVAFLRCAVDIRNVDVEAASAAGILVTHATPGFAAAVAELGVGLMIDAARGISRSVADYQRNEMPPQQMGRELRGASVGIIGYGEIGSYLAGLCHAFGMNVLACDPHNRIGLTWITQLPLAEMLAQSDFVVCLAVATPETEKLMDARAFAAMRRDAVFVNLSRGELVDEAALRSALDEERIARAAMDVGRAPDQMPSPLLAGHPRVIATPHIAGLTEPAVRHQALHTVEQVRALARGEIPPNAVNPERASRLSRLRGANRETLP